MRLNFKIPQLDLVKFFLKTNFKSILNIALILFILYWVIYILTPRVTMSTESKQKLDSLNIAIKTIELQQKKLDSNITVYTKEVEKIDTHIEHLKTEKTIIKEIYHEKIDAIDHYTDAELDEFFAKRYGYNPR